jgi:hypothetical protein
MTRDAFAWFPILAKRHDERAPRIARLRSYTDGNPPLPSMNKETKPAWAAFQRKSTMNLGGLIVSSAMGRLRYSGVVVGKERTGVEALANRIARDNRLPAVLAEAFEWAGTDGEAYLMTAAHEDGKPVITPESAQHVTVSKDPLRPWIALAAMKVWRDIDAGLDFAYVWDGAFRVKFSRPIRDKKNVLATRVAGGNWEPIEILEVGKVPLVILAPTADGKGAFEPHTDTIDRVHTTILNRMTTLAMQAHRQMAVEGELEEADEDGNPIDYSETFTASIGAVWQLPKGVKIWESQTTDITPMLTAAKDDLRDLAAVSRTSLSNLNPEGANQSAEGSRSAKEGEITRASGYLERMNPAVELAMVRAIRIADPDALTEADTVTVLFKPPGIASDTEATASLVQAKAADIPWRTRMLRYGGFSAEEVDRMELELAMEQLTNFTQEPPNAAAA